MSNSKILNIVKFENSENFQFAKLQKFLIKKIPKISNLKNSKKFCYKKQKNFNSKNFQNFTISKIIKFLNFEEYWIIKVLNLRSRFKNSS